jgi:Family of unknown function (DUF6515)
MSKLQRIGLTFLGVMLLWGLEGVGDSYKARAVERDFRPRQFMDSRYHHDRSYPVRGQHFKTLPPGHRSVPFGPNRYYFFNGAWFRPWGGRFLVVAPPFGLVVSFLPPFYTTLIVGGVPYYYADEVYYRDVPGGYMVVAPPRGEISPVPSSPALSPPNAPPDALPEGQTPGERIFIYPRQGQDEKKQADDRYECHRWAVGQAGYDPTQPPVGMPEPQKLQKYADYKRAMGACLEGRGYSVK